MEKCFQECLCSNLCFEGCPCRAWCRNYQPPTTTTTTTTVLTTTTTRTTTTTKTRERIIEVIPRNVAGDGHISVTYFDDLLMGSSHNFFVEFSIQNSPSKEFTLRQFRGAELSAVNGTNNVILAVNHQSPIMYDWSGLSGSPIIHFAPSRFESLEIFLDRYQ